MKIVLEVIEIEVKLVWYLVWFVDKMSCYVCIVLGICL